MTTQTTPGPPARDLLHPMMLAGGLALGLVFGLAAILTSLDVTGWSDLGSMMSGSWVTATGCHPIGAAS